MQEIQALTHQYWQTMSLWSLLWDRGHCDAGTGVSPLALLKGNHNVTAYRFYVYGTVFFFFNLSPTRF